MHDRCRGTTDSGKPCQCMEFSPTPEKRLLCEECNHGRSNHPPPRAGDTSRPADPLNAKKLVLQTFHDKISGRASGTIAMERAGNTSMDDARQETLSGFRDKATNSSKKVSIKVEYPTKPPHHGFLIEHKARPKKNNIPRRIGSRLHMRTKCEFNQNKLQDRIQYHSPKQVEGDLVMEKPPSRTAIARMERQCCAVRSGPTMKLEIDQNWSHNEVTEFLKDLLPLPFDYAERHFRRNRRSSGNLSPVWVLVNKEKGEFDVVPDERPNGRDLYRYKGREGASSAESHIYIGQYESTGMNRKTLTQPQRSTARGNP